MAVITNLTVRPIDITDLNLIIPALGTANTGLTAAKVLAFPAVAAYAAAGSLSVVDTPVPSAPVVNSAEIELAELAASIRGALAANTFPIDLNGQAFTNCTTLWLDVSAYGAKGDGASDDTAALQAALIAASAALRPVFIGPGTYKITSPVTVPSNTTIIGTKGTIILASITQTSAPTNSAFVAQLPNNIGGGTVTSNTTRTNQVVVGGWSGAAPAAGQVIMLSHGLSNFTYDIISVSGSGPYTVTVDRAIAVPFVSSDTAQIFSSQPTNIRIFGNGMTFRGTADRMIELVTVHHGHVEDCHYDTTGGGSISATNICFSFDTGGRDVGFDRCTIDLTGVTTAGAAIALESADGGYISNCTVKGGDTGFYRVDCHAVSMVNCYANRTGLSTSTGSGLAVGKSVTGLGSYGCRVVDCKATGCYYGLTITGAEESVVGFDATACNTGLNINSGAPSKLYDFHASYCTSQIASLASDCTIFGLRAVGLPGAPAGGLVAVLTGSTRIYDALIVSTASTFVAAAIKLTGTAVEVYNSTITLADATNAHGIYATAGSIKVGNTLINGSVSIGVRLDSGLVGDISSNCDFSAVTTPIFATGNNGWRLQPTGKFGTISMADADKTASYVQSYVDILECTGAITSNRTLTMAFAAIGHIWTINNKTTGGHNVLVSFGTGTTVSCPAGITRVYFDGTNAVQA